VREIGDATFERLKAHAEPLVDTLDSVINRALDALEEKSGTDPLGLAPNRVRQFDPAVPPNLAHTTVKSIELCGRILKPNETYWNTLLIATLREAKSRGTGPDELGELVLGNCLVGRKEDEGYRFYKDLGLSIQGQDSNAAWRATYHIANKLCLPLKVAFAWQDNSKSAFPGSPGTFVVETKP
jgi:hypothetical protein